MSENALDVLDIVHEYLETDRTFYSIVRFLDGGSRNNIVAAHLRNSNQVLAILRAYMIQSVRQNVVLNIPLGNIDISGNFFDPIQVAPTPDQVRAATEQHVNIRDMTCSICQEPVECATRIRACGHCFHSDCISQWFTMNPRCPMCRHDIRDLQRSGGGLSNESSSMHPNQES